MNFLIFSLKSLCNVYSALILLEKKFFVNYLSNVLMALLEAYRKHPFAPCLDVITTAIGMNFPRIFSKQNFKKKLLYKKIDNNIIKKYYSFY